MSKDRLFGALDNLQGRKQDQRDKIPAVLGQGDTNKTVDVLGRPGMVWVRLYGDRNQAQPALNRVTASVHGLPVYVAVSTDRRTGRRSYEVVGLGDNEILTAGGTRAFDPYLPEHASSHEWNPNSRGRDVVNIYPRAFAFGRVYPTSPASMRCGVSPIKYAHHTTLKTYAGGFTKDFTADIPATTGKAVLVLVCLNGATNALAYVKGSEFSWTGYTDPIPAAGIPQPAAGQLVLSCLLLYNGMTTITEACFRYEYRLPFQTLSSISEGTELGSDAMALGYALISDGAGGCVWRQIVVWGSEEPASPFPGQIWIDTGESTILVTEDGLPILTEEGGYIGGSSPPIIKIRNADNDGWERPSQFGEPPNYSEFESDGTLVMHGNATTWEDVRVPAVATKLGGSKDPGFAIFKDNGSSSQGVFVYWFDKASEEELYFMLQIPHTYKLESNIYPHVHWIPKTNGAENAVASWGLEYTWADIGETFGNTNILYANAHYPADASLVAGRHYLTSFAAIAGTGHDFVSSMLVCRIFRNATGAGSSTDDYDDDAGLLEIDFHIEQDTLGSRGEFAK